MQLLQPLGDERNVARSNLEKAIAAEGTTFAALQVLRLRFGNSAKEIVGAIEDARIGFIVRFFGHATHNR